MPMRTRSTSDVLGVSTKQMRYRLMPEGTEFIWAPGYAVRAFPARISFITDVYGEKGNYNPCDHMSIDSWISPRAYPSFWRGTSGKYALPVVDGAELAFPLNPLLPFEGVSSWPWISDISAATLSGWSMDAYNAFNSQVPTTVSLPNFLYELKDMKGMIPSINRKSLSKTASNNLLAFEFGVKPFISDIKNIVNMADSVSKRLKHLIAYQRKTSHLTFERDVKSDEDYSFFRNIESIDNHYVAGNVNGLVFKRISGSTHFQVGASLYQDLQDLEDANSQLKALLATGGFNHPARVVWNAIPYSFVVDWFFSVGKLLDTLSVQPFGGEWSVTNVGYSIKSEASYSVKAVLANYPSHYDDPFRAGSQIGTVRVKRYIRKRGFPAFSLFLTDGSLSPEQLVLGLAMLEQRRR